MKNNSPKFNFFLLLSLGLLLLGFAIFLIFFSNNSSDDVTDDSSSTRSYVELRNYSLASDALSTADNEAIHSAIVDYFSFAYPNFTFLTFSSPEYSEDGSSIGFSLFSDSNREFSGVLSLAENKNSPLLTLFSDRNQEIFSFSAKNSFDVIDRSSDSLATSLIDRLPYISNLDNGTEFSLYYFGGDENILSISIDTDFYTEACQEAKRKSLSWISSLNSPYASKVTLENFSCDEE